MPSESAPPQAAVRAVASINTEELPKHFESASAEVRWDNVWQESGIYHYDEGRPREQTFVVDTPPPTVSGSLHVGHMFSYTQPDVVVRFWRMRGKNIFYPMGWDDNGLPTRAYRSPSRPTPSARNARGWSRARTSSSSAISSHTRTSWRSRTCSGASGSASTGVRRTPPSTTTAVGSRRPRSST
jgi:hypothetical protein